MRPIVLVTPDHDPRPSRRGPVPTYALTQDYADAVLRAGGLPWVTPYTADEAVLDAYIAQAHGVLLTGGDFDVDPALFGETPHPALGTLKPARTTFEAALYARAKAKGLPVFGVCGGMQLINVFEGGTLYQDLPSELPDSTIEHTQPHSKAEPAHDVVCVPGTFMAELGGTVPVNSTHHQAVRTLGAAVHAAAHSPDGVVEALVVTPGFIRGVQWHPEAMPHAVQAALYTAFVDACRAHGAAQSA